MSDEILASCSNCIYFRPGAHHPNKDGVCRRNPPSQWADENDEIETTTTESPDDEWSSVATAITIGRSYTGWPDVDAHDWCGDHRLR